MLKLSPADELADVRAEIARLKAREAQLRSFFLTAPLTARSGRWSRVEIEEAQSNRFNPSLLPDTIRSDDRFCQTRLVQIIRCLPVPFTAAHRHSRPGWPISHATQSVAN
jgi:hypothetical protein